MDAPQEEDGHQQREQQQQAQQEEHAQQHEQHQAHEQQQQRSERKRKKKWGEERVDALALLQQQQASAGAEGEHQAQQHEQQQHEGEEQCSKKRRSRWEPEPPPPAAIICSSGLPMPIQLPQSLAHLIDVNPESLELNRQLNVVGEEQGEQGEHSKVGLDATVMLCRVCRKGCTALDVAISIWNAHRVLSQCARTHTHAHTGEPKAGQPCAWPVP